MSLPRIKEPVLVDIDIFKTSPNEVQINKDEEQKHNNKNAYIPQWLLDKNKNKSDKNSLSSYLSK